MTNYVVATVKQWNLAAFEKARGNLPGNWHLIERREDLSLENLRAINPRYIFFPHWSWRVPDDVVASFECVCFHMTDVPYGRGGSPLQNLIIRGHKDTMLSALRMVSELDGGPVYMKRPLSLADSAQAIFERAATNVFMMIDDIVAGELKPVAQSGEPVTFSRRRPAESRLPDHASMDQVYDFIRMLDADTYPPAFLEYGDLHLEFRQADYCEDGVEAVVKITNVKRATRE